MVGSLTSAFDIFEHSEPHVHGAQLPSGTWQRLHRVPWLPLRHDCSSVLGEHRGKCQVAAPTRIALVFAGAVGGFGGPIQPGAGAAPSVPSGTFNISAACWRRTLLDVSVPGQRVTTFVQSWSVGMRQLIEQELQPAASSFEPQAYFAELPAEATGSVALQCQSTKNKNTKLYSYRNLQSQWTVRLHAMNLVMAHERQLPSTWFSSRGSMPAPVSATPSRSPRRAIHWRRERSCERASCTSGWV